MSMDLLLFEIETVPLSVFWSFFLIFGIGGFLLVRLHPLFLIPILLLVFFFYLLQMTEIHSDLEPGIIKQEGYSYIVYFYLLVLIGPAILSLAGIPAWFRQRKKKKTLT